MICVSTVSFGIPWAKQAQFGEWLLPQKGADRSPVLATYHICAKMKRTLCTTFKLSVTIDEKPYILVFLSTASSTA
jgi:hypothetical protein